MIYNYKVKRNGVYYEAGENVPESKEVSPVSSIKQAETTNDESATTQARRGRPKKTD